MIPGILGKKIGMTQIFTEDGVKMTVTVLEAGPCTVQVVKVSETDGYNAVQLGFNDAKESRVKKPQREYLRSKGLKPKKFVSEIRYDGTPDVKVGDEITNRIFQAGDMLDVMGTSKGKGFQGGMRRWGWSGGGDTHGSMSHRAPGSIGQSSYPSRVFRGLRMAGQMGAERVTVQNLEVVEVNSDDNTVLVKGAVPGANGSYVVIRYAKKRPVAPRKAQEEEEVKVEAGKVKEDQSELDQKAVSEE
jgi:large subunit ribosomal protein L3